MTEQDLVNSIIEYIALLGGVATRINSGIIPIDGDDGRRRVVRGAPIGTADIIACIHGRYVAIECKVRPNKPTVYQLDFLSSVARADGIAVIAYSLDDVIAIVEALK